MKRMGMLLAVCLLLCTCLGGVAVNAETFGAEYAYVTENALSVLPKTLEAVLEFPADKVESERGGVVFGNYSASGVACVNLEIYQFGSPRLYVVDNDGGTIDLVFNKADVYTDEKVHLAVVIDTEEVHCYINGEWVQTIQSALPADVTFENRAVIGGDLRLGNGQYFKGTLESVALYTDKRTADEIAADAVATTADTAELFGAYTLANAGDELKPTAGNGPVFSKINHEGMTYLQDYQTATEYDYSMALIGDIQSITYLHPEKLHYIYDWLVENADSKKIEMVIGLGDITDKDTDEEWELAKQEMQKLDGVVPYTIVRGNHDSFGQYKNYFSYEEYKDTVDEAFSETMLSSYRKMTIGGVKYLFLNLDLTMSDSLIEWANAVIADNPDYNVIISTHIYLGTNKKPLGESYQSSFDRYGVVNNGDEAWEKLYSQHENISMVICGHCPTDKIIVNQRQGVHGNTVTEMMVDPQGTDKAQEGVGLVAMLYFSNEGKTVDVEYYSTIKEAHYLQDNQFRLEVEVVESASALWWIIGGAVAIVTAAAVIIFVKKKTKKQA